jgi:hypothetical protein
MKMPITNTSTVETSTTNTVHGAAFASTVTTGSPREMDSPRFP